MNFITNISPCTIHKNKKRPKNINLKKIKYKTHTLKVSKSEKTSRKSKKAKTSY